MKPWLRALLVIGGSSVLLGGDCTFGRPIVDESDRYYPSDGVISCTGTRCADLPVYELELPPPLADSPCARDLPTVELGEAVRAGQPLADMRFTLTSEGPRDVNLSTVALRDACVVLSGPVRLTLGAGSTLTHVTVMFGPATTADPDASVTATRGATPNLYLGHAGLERVSLQAIEEGEPSGSAQLEFSTCSQCETRIDALTVTESQVQNSRLAAGKLTMVGGAFDTVELAFEYGLLAGVIANDMRTTACNTLSLVGANIAGRASKIGPCDCGLASSPPDAALPDAAPVEAGVADANDADAEPPEAGATDAQAVDAASPDAGAADAGELDASVVDEACSGATITQTTFFGGMIDGKVRAENSTFRSVLLARNAPTALDMWNTSIELSVSCAEPLDIRLDKTSGIGCTSCDTPATATACRLDQAPELTVNKCKPFKGHLPACEPPLPTRSTPAIPMPPKLGQGLGP
jgi:hypothetical protein